MNYDVCLYKYKKNFIFIHMYNEIYNIFFFNINFFYYININSCLILIYLIFMYVYEIYIEDIYKYL